MAHISNLTFQDWDDYTLEAEDGFMDSSKYSTPENESDKRKQLQTQHSQIRDYINTTLVGKINAIDDGFALKSESGKTLTLSYSAANNNRITVVLTAADGTTTLDTKTLDLTLGSWIKSISYDSSNERIVVTTVLNGSESTSYVDISSLASESWVLARGYETVSNVDAVRTRVSNLEYFRDTTVPATYETLANANLVRGRVESLETFKNTTVPSTYETKSDANTHKNNSNIHVTASDKTNWNGKQVQLEAGAYIVIEDLANGHQKISAANGTIAVDYQNATNKPSINSVTLVGNKTFADLGLPFVTDSDGNICMEE